MRDGKQGHSQSFFRNLLRILPLDFRANYGGEMEGVFALQRREVQEHGGPWDFLKLWAETLAGIFRTAPREHWEILKQDCVYAFRMMRRNPGFTAVAVLTLALGIGANTAIFSVVHSVLLRPLPYPSDQQLIFIEQQAQKAGIGDLQFSAHEVDDYRAQNHTLSELVEYHTMSFTLFGHGDPDRVRAAVVSYNYFDMFGVRPLLGRTFLPADDKPGAPAVLILSNEYWKTKFNGDPQVVGKVFEMNDKPHTVVGVLPPIPQYPLQRDVYMPSSACPFRSSKAFIEDRDSRMMEVFARLKPGVALAQARADLSTIAARLRVAYPKSYPDNVGYAAVANTLRSELTREARPTLLVLLAAAVFVLLIACANVANLTLSRMSRREREISLRTALGAGRSRLLRQLLTESFLLALAGGLLGLMLAYATLELLTEFAARLTPRAHEIRIDSGVLTFTLVVALGTSILFGTVSALFSRANLGSSLREGTAGPGAGHRRSRVRGILIVSQMAFSFMLLIGAGLMLRSFVKIQRQDLGFIPQRVLAMRTTYNWSKYAKSEQLAEVTRKLLDLVQAEPGVLSAAVSSSYPLEGEALASGPSANTFQVEGRVLGPGEAPPVANFVAVSPDYFRTIGIALKEGRFFTAADQPKSLQVVVIDETSRRLLWPHQDPIGRRISADNGAHWFTVVGVVSNVRDFGAEHALVNEIYVPMEQSPAPATLIVRTIADPRTMVQSISRQVHEVDSQTAISHITTLEEARREYLSSPRLTASLLGIFAGLALLIATAGIGGIMALQVSQRTREIGIRMALGAQPLRVLVMILSQGLGLAMLGIAIGFAGALALTGFVKSLLFQVSPSDPVTFSSVACVLLAAAALATYLPARRAAEVEPIEALRCE